MYLIFLIIKHLEKCLYKHVLMWPILVLFGYELDVNYLSDEEKKSLKNKLFL